MTRNLIILLITVSLFVGFYVYRLEEHRNPHNFQKLINRIYAKVQKEQYQTSGSKLLFDQQVKGLYSSYVQLNLMDNHNTWFYEQLRKDIKIVDNNMFVTNFVLYSILECYKLGTVEIHDKSFEHAYEAILKFIDKNQKPGIPIYTFWPQIEKNNTWTAYPDNLFSIIGIYLKMPKWIQEIPSIIFGPGFGPDEIENDMAAFHIPSDNDDSGLNIVIGTMLNQLKDRFPDLVNKWNSINYDYKGFYDKIKHFSYRPFDSLSLHQTTNVSDCIDPRTYYYLQGFLNQSLDQAAQSGVQPSLILFTTWLLNQNEEIPNLVEQPFHTNNVDVTVNANALFGLNNLLQFLTQSEAEDLFDNDLRQMMTNVTNLLQWAINSNIINVRTDLALTYYPSVYDFYWFVARNVHYLNSNKDQLKFPEQEKSRQILESTMKNAGTQQIISKSISDEEYVYWEEFLGIYDNKDWHEDRLFSTSVALNALIDTWTIFENGKLYYSPDTPQNVKNIIQKGMHFLENYIDRDGQSLQNVFFSGSVKGFSDLPFFYPGNEAVYTNGTKIDPLNSTMNAIESDLIYAWKGFVSGQYYNNLVNNELWFNFSTPTSFEGFNQPFNFFPFWSSPAITLSFSMLAISKHAKLQEQP